ncbi:MAG: type II toxin-antitoxin system HicB family antitoxin [Patescibacteria group bacterium]
MPKILNFKVLVEKDEDGYFIASVSAIPGCHTQGRTYEEATVRIKEAIELCLEVAEKDRDYRKLINFPTQDKTETFIGILDVPISMKYAY